MKNRCISEKNTRLIELMRNNLKSLRQARGWSIAELAQATRILETVLVGIEQGKDFRVKHLIT